MGAKCRVHETALYQWRIHPTHVLALQLGDKQGLLFGLPLRKPWLRRGPGCGHAVALPFWHQVDDMRLGDAQHYLLRRLGTFCASFGRL